MAAEGIINVIIRLTGTQEFQKGLKQVSSNAKKFGQSLKKVGSDAKIVARNLTILGGIVGVAIGKAVQASKEFEDGFTDVVTLLDESSFSTKTLKEGIDSLRRGVRQLAKDSGQDFESLLQALFDLISAGVDAEESIVALGDAADLAIAGATTVDSAVKALTASTTAFGKAAGTTREIAETFFTAQKFGVTTVEALGEEFSKVAGLASTLGLSLKETLAAAAALTANGAKPTTVAMTELRAALTAVIKAQSKLPNQSEEVQQALSLENIKRIGLVAAIQETTAALDNDIVAQQKLFGNVRALSAVLSLTGQQADLYTKIIGEMSDKTQSAATFTDALAVKQNTLQFQQKKLAGTIKDIGITIGDALTPAIISLIDLFVIIINELGPDIKTFFEDVGASLLIFVDSIKENIPGTVQTIKDAAKGILDALKGMSGAFTIIGGLLTAFINLMGIIAKLIPGVSKETLAFTVIFLQLTGGFRLAISLAKSLRAAYILVESAMVVLGLISKTGMLIPFLAASAKFTAAAIAQAAKTIASLVATGASMVGLSGIMTTVSVIARGFWLALLGPVGIAAAIILAIGGIITAIFGFENVVITLARAWESVVNVIKKAFDIVKKFFGFSGDKEINVNVNQTITRTDEKIPGLSMGGSIHGPGTGTSDSIPMWGSDGEFMMRAKAVKKFGTNFMHMINRGILPGFADGGLIPAVAGRFTPIPSAVVAGASPNKALRPVNLTIPGVGTFPFFDEQSTAEGMQRALRKSNLNKSARLPAWYK